MKIIALALLFIILTTTAYAGIPNPVDIAGDKIRRDTSNAVDDALSKFKMSMNETKKEAKIAIKEMLGMFLEIFTVLAIGWIFTFLLEKNTAKMVKLVLIVCGVTQFIKLFV